VSLRPTLRRSGKHMATVSVSWHLDGDQLASIISLECWFDVSDAGQREDDELETLTKKRAEAAVRDHLWNHALSRLDFWSDYMTTADEDEQERASAWAVREVRRLWPEMEVER
jgi:hypothetical protein